MLLSTLPWKSMQTRYIMPKQKLPRLQDDTSSDAVQIAVDQLLEQISKRDQRISWIRAERATTIRSLKLTLKLRLLETERHLSERERQLSERETQLHEILTSRTWRMALFLQRIRNFLVPLGSRRAQILQGGLNMIISPFKKFKRD